MDERVINRILDKMVEVSLPDRDTFLIVKETLTRIGVASQQEDCLYQSCHILHKQGRYYITHFKLLFELDGKASNFDSQDQARMNTIAYLLDSWGLVKILDKARLSEFLPINKVKIVPSSQKEKWRLVAKHRIGS